MSGPAQALSVTGGALILWGLFGGFPWHRPDIMWGLYACGSACYLTAEILAAGWIWAAGWAALAIWDAWHWRWHHRNRKGVS